MATDSSTVHGVTDGSPPGALPGARVTLSAGELEELRARVATWDEQFDDAGLGDPPFDALLDRWQADVVIAAWVVRLVFPRLSLVPGMGLATERRREADRCIAWTFPVWEDGTWVNHRPGDDHAGPQQDHFMPDRMHYPTLVGAMGAVQGDGTLEAYIEAAVLYRELVELGSRGRADRWRAHRIVDTDPFDVDPPGSEVSVSGGHDRPSWSPEARLGDDGTVTVRFWTQAVDDRRLVLEHRHRFDETFRNVDFIDDIRLLLRPTDRADLFG